MIRFYDIDGDAIDLRMVGSDSLKIELKDVCLQEVLEALDEEYDIPEDQFIGCVVIDKQTAIEIGTKLLQLAEIME